MPYHTEWTDNEIALEHGGVTIYHAYKDDDERNGTLWYGFVTDEAALYEDSFDVRELAAWPRVPDPDLRYYNEAHVLNVLRAAIDAGELTQDGVVKPE
jgi:hypothetical protein